MNQFLNFNSLPNYGMGYADNLYNQPCVSPAFPNFFEKAHFGYGNENPAYAMSSPFDYGYSDPYADTAYSQPIENDNFKQMFMLMMLLKQMESGATNSSADEDIDASDTPADIGDLKAKWSKYNLSDKFYSKVMDISERIHCNPHALMAVMKSESGLNSKAKNPNSSATGLIQFMDATAKGLGTTTAALKRMSPERQLDYVEKYLVKMKKMAKIGEDEKLDGATLYSLVFLPAYAKREVLCEKGSSAYNANKGLDLNKDGDIDKKDLGRRVQNLMA